MEWKGRDRAAYNERIWATKAMAEMAHLRCSQGKAALTSVRRAYVSRMQSADRIITAWRKIKTMKLAGPVLADRRQAAITALKAEHTMYTAVVVAATDYLPTDELAQQGVGFTPENGGTLIQVSYGGKNDDTAVATIIDPDTGEVINTVVLDKWTDAEGEEHAPHHVGSVVIDGDDVWTGSSRAASTRALVDHNSAVMNIRHGGQCPASASMPSTRLRP